MDVTGIGEVAQAATAIANKFWPDKTEVEKAKIAQEMQDTMNEFKLASAQTDINLEEAKSTNWFVAGWRPYIGWICGCGLAYEFLLMPIFNGISTGFGGHAIFVALDTGTLVSCLSGLLGLGTLRTTEKVYNVHNTH
jgi:phenylpyruvate tautomerase PptA (4-oxalocrotonate tautomerase family)